MYAQDALNRHPLVFEKDLRRCRYVRRKSRKRSCELHNKSIYPALRGLELDGYSLAETECLIAAMRGLARRDAQDSADN